MLSQPEHSAQHQARRAHAKRSQNNKRLLYKIRRGLWSREELKWLLTHLGPALTPEIVAEIRRKQQALRARKGVPYA